MPYDEQLAERIRDLVVGEPGVTEKRMFGGLAFLVNGNLAVAASSRGDLMVRSDPAQADDLVDDVAVSRMEMRGRRMEGWLRVTPDAVSSDDELGRWVEHGVVHAGSLPAKDAGERA
ncbi:MAG TPA: TfoX/Sxy family protein [Marmoricola sp.]|jgi:TfoX/Sxy family transcriptional regulator of competence genes|nr:TfoX/Sxy family protein [Marmoricola sp.]